jgi:diguanylate cyclase (GGDEF)-like protein
MSENSLPKILIVNDDASTLLALASTLEEPSKGATYEVLTVQSGEEALRKVLKHTFAVILLDVSMPVMDGFETAEAIRAHPRSASVPIIFVTAHYGDEFNRLKGYEKGAADYLFAPIIPKIVQSKVAVFVELYLKNLELELKTSQLESINSDLRIQKRRDIEDISIQLENEIKRRELAEQRLALITNRDALTNLHSRQSLFDCINKIIDDDKARTKKLALIFINLNNFKGINEAFGWGLGDELLKKIAHQLRCSVRDIDTIARVGADEFAILFESYVNSRNVKILAEEISIHSHQIGETLIQISSTYGISFYPEECITADNLFKHAYSAMHNSKKINYSAPQVLAV